MNKKVILFSVILIALLSILMKLNIKDILLMTGVVLSYLYILILDK